MIDAITILNYLKANKERLKNDYHITQIGLFGSIVRDEHNENSDIDLVIEFEPGTSDLFSLKLRLKNEIQGTFNRQVDLCRLKYINPIFKDQIQSEVKYA
jgi:hypothetical protein